MESLTLERFLNLAGNAKRVAMIQELNSKDLQAGVLFQNLRQDYLDAVFLESDIHVEGIAPRSFIAFDALATLRIQTADRAAGNPFTKLRHLQQELGCVFPQGYANTGSIIGYIAYDAIRFFEDIPDRHEQDSLPDLFFNFYRTTLVFDHTRQKLLVSMLVDINGEAEQAYKQGQLQLSALLAKIKNFADIQSLVLQRVTANLTAATDMDDAAFKAIVLRAKEYIHKGDIFQVVLSRRFTEPYQGCPFRLYQALARNNLAPYMFYLPVDDAVIIGASPECLIKVEGRRASVNPIAGTRRRTTPLEDAAISQNLLADEKERAEHMMLVDLARNDLGRVSVPGTVKVTSLLQIKLFSHVIHLTSTVQGELRQEIDALEALAAAFPAGTLSGAPKIRAMEIIDALETSRRGIYGGAICRLDYQGNLDSCIAIRMAVLKNQTATVRTGAGIVFDSNPVKEAEETRHKAASMLSAIRQAQAGGL